MSEEITIEYFDVKQGDKVIGVGFQVGSVFQEFDPNEAGFVPMTSEIAEQRAAEVLERLNA